MKRAFEKTTLGGMELPNRFVFPPIKLAYGNPEGVVTERQLIFYGQIAEDGPGLLILEPVSVTLDGKEHPKQLCVHLPESERELKKIVEVVHDNGRRACLHLNHAGAGANPMITKTNPKAPSSFACPAREHTARALTGEEIYAILEGYSSAAEKAVKCGFDAIEIQAGHGYLVSQFLNSKINVREDSYGEDRLLFIRQVLLKVKKASRNIPLILRISGDEMSPEFGISREDLHPLFKLAEDQGVSAVHVGMGNTCFSPPWYFHHGSLPEKPQMDSLAWIRENTRLPLIVAGRMGRKEKIAKVMDGNLADFVALGRPLIADPDLLGKWHDNKDQEAVLCGYCLQGCFHRVKTGEGLGCNFNPTIGRPEPGPAEKPLKILVAGGGPAGMSAAVHLSRRGHHVTLAEKEDRLGGQFRLAWQAPGKENMQASLDSLTRSFERSGVTVLMRRKADAALLEEIKPDLLVWAVGAVQNIPEIPGLNNTYNMTSIQYFKEEKEVKGPRVLVIGAGRTGLEIAEKLGREGYEVTATKRTDPIGSMMEMITKKLAMKRIGEMKNVVLMPHTTVKAFHEDSVDVEQDETPMSLEPFETVILASGMLSAEEPEEEIQKAVPKIEIIGDAQNVQDIFTATQAGYNLACTY